MMKIYLSSEHMKHSQLVCDLVEHEILYNPNFNGDTFSISEGDYTWIDEVDEIDGAFLLHTIINRIEEAQDKPSLYKAMLKEYLETGDYSVRYLNGKTVCLTDLLGAGESIDLFKEHTLEANCLYIDSLFNK